MIAALCAASALYAPAPSSATPPNITPKVLQCDGSFTTGSITSHPTPTVRADEQNSNPGLKVGQRRLSILSATFALWRFDGTYGVTVSSNYTVGCTVGCCKTWYYNHVSTNGSANLDTGRCSYRDAVNDDCSVPSDMTSFGTSHAPVQIGACPANPSTLAVASSSFPITAQGPLPLAGPQPGDPTLGLSSSALQLNGSSQYATTPDSSAWDLPASYTLAAWVKPSAANGRIVSQQDATGYWGIAVSTGGRLRHFDSRDVAGPDAVLPDSTPSLTDGSWHLVHVVRRNSVDRRFFIDGRLVATVVASSSDSFSGHSISAALEIGRASSGEYFNGLIDDVRIERAALDPDAILLEYNTEIHKYSADSGATFSVAAGAYSGSPANGTTSAVTYIPGAPYTATSRWSFGAQSIDGESTFSPTYGFTIDSSSPVAPGLTAVPTSPNDITWNWSLPPRVCLPPGSAAVTYHLVDALTDSNLIPPGSMNHPTFTVGENVPGSSNQLIARKIRVTDTWGSGLSVATSIYTLANPPLAASVVPSAVSTGSALISWNQSGNPSYTRYLVSMSQDSLFLTGVSTPATVANNLTGSSIALSGLAIGTTYFVRVQAISGRSTDPYGGTGSVFISTSFTTLPGAPNLGGVSGTNLITWNWTAVPGAQYYKLFAVDGSTLYTGGNLSHPQTGLATNTQYTARVEAVSGNGAGARATATTFTLADDPTAPVVNEVHTSSIIYSWTGGLNPAYTFYEVRVTTDASFGIIVSTLTVNATTATVTGLLQGTTYYARVRSINGGQLYGPGFAVFATTRTIPNPSITSVLAPPSAYVPPNGSIGQWHFDESTGTTAADSSGGGNAAALTCVAAACASTPTFVAGPAGLGSAVSYSGVAGGLVIVPDTATYDSIGSLAVSAWVNPSSLSQPERAGIVVRGSGTVENFALDMSTDAVRRFRFMAKPGHIATSTSPVTAGTWVHLIGVYDAAAASATLYVNGRPASTVLAVPARTAATHDITIGNRQSGIATGYDRGFLGSIDSVRVQHRALTAAEALAEYQGSFVSTITPPSPNSAVLIGLAPNAFGAPATMSVSVDPLTHPITITPAVLNAGLTVIPTGFTLVPNSLVEIVPIVGGNPFTQTLGSSASVSVPYADAGGDNIIDGTSPPMAASAIKVYTLNTTVNRWEALESYVDTSARRVIFFTPHFSVFALFAPLTIGSSLSEVRVYPIPWKPGTRGRFDAAGVTFDRLPVSGTIRILTLAGERVREFTFDGGASGSIVWNGVTDWGQRAA
ncbi:MAG: LamG-like jellyroll fold domain-containing protein, partial [Elusimicrobiota bacterium]|nr:LamG-like jellyroll fold domain-containing protein [Elusimicrobiota bacterium]